MTSVTAALIGLLGIALTGALGVSVKLWIDRPTAEQQAKAADTEAQAAAGTLALSEVEYWRSLVEPLRADVARLSAALDARTAECNEELRAIKAKHEADVHEKDHAYQVLQIQVANQLMRIMALEDQVTKLGGKP